VTEFELLKRFDTLMEAREGRLLAQFHAIIHHAKDQIMSDLTKLSASVDALTAQAAVNTKAIADLVALAQASGADQAAIDTIQAKIDAATAQLTTDDAQDPSATPPAPAPAAPVDDSAPAA